VTRSFLRSVCRGLIGVVLLAQVAVSAHTCPGLALDAKTSVSMSAASSMNGTGHAFAEAADQRAVDCAGMAGPMDPGFANLCAEHCHQGQQSDQAVTVTVPAALLTALYITPLAPEPVVAPRPAAAATSALVAASPPHTILHCCFRI
jgi:hypothetical protein